MKISLLKFALDEIRSDYTSIASIATTKNASPLGQITIIIQKTRPIYRIFGYFSSLIRFLLTKTEGTLKFEYLYRFRSLIPRIFIPFETILPMSLRTRAHFWYPEPSGSQIIININLPDIFYCLWCQVQQKITLPLRSQTNNKKSSNWVPWSNSTKNFSRKTISATTPMQYIWGEWTALRN